MQNLPIESKEITTLAATLVGQHSPGAMRLATLMFLSPIYFREMPDDLRDQVLAVQADCVSAQARLMGVTAAEIKAAVDSLALTHQTVQQLDQLDQIDQLMN